MELWRRVWREGFAPLLPRKGLESLRDALEIDDPRLLQGATSSPPPPLVCVQDWPVEKTCLIGWCAWQGGEGDAASVGEVEQFFARTCYEADQRLGEPAACRYLLNWYDDTPRGRMRLELLAEVQLALVAAAQDERR